MPLIPLDASSGVTPSWTFLIVEENNHVLENDQYGNWDR